MESRRLIVLAAFIGISMASLDSTMVATIGPAVVDQLGDLSLYPAVFAAYLLAASVTLPVYSQLADRVAKKRLFMESAVIFVAGSVTAGLAPSMTLLVVGRLIQGIGAGGLLVVPIAVVAEIYPPGQRGAAMGSIGIVWAVASIVGPLLGSMFVVLGNWRVAFLINIPVCALALLVLRGQTWTQAPSRGRSVDVPGAAVLGAAVACLLIGVGRLRDAGLTDPLALLLIGAAGALLVGFYRIESTSPDPLLPLDLMRIPHLGGPNVAAFLGFFVAFPIVSYLPLYVESGSGSPGFAAAATIIPLSITWSGLGVVAGRWVDRFGARSVAVAGLAILAAATFGGGLAITRDMVRIVPFMVAAGVGLGMVTPSLMVAVQNAVGRDRLGVATGTVIFIRSLGGGVGVGLLGALSGITRTAAGAPVPDAAMRTVLLAGGFAATAAGVLTMVTAAESRVVPVGKPGAAAKPSH